MITYTPRTIVNGSLLRNFLNQSVSIHVNVEPEAERQTKLITAKTTDDIDIKIQLDEPLNAPIKGWVEVIGIPDSSTSIRNKEIIIFSNEAGDEAYDKNGYNTLVTLLNNCNDIFGQQESLF